MQSTPFSSHTHICVHVHIKIGFEMIMIGYSSDSQCKFKHAYASVFDDVAGLFEFQCDEQFSAWSRNGLGFL